MEKYHQVWTDNKCLATVLLPQLEMTAKISLIFPSCCVTPQTACSVSASHFGKKLHMDDSPWAELILSNGNGLLNNKSQISYIFLYKLKSQITKTSTSVVFSELIWCGWRGCFIACFTDRMGPWWLVNLTYIWAAMLSYTNRCCAWFARCCNQQLLFNRSSWPFAW